ncbi:MAG: hypothetical protein A2025_03580 [Chloroflexi bacterium RBG_19FT_COMBO_47_15]|nr:MAG: hypothetical protein A2025_03580 [Chloroflexi bacterium RBG_19FT_COMBO_47_15]
MRFLWILLAIIFGGIFAFCLLVLLFNAPFGIIAGETMPMIVFGVIALFSLAASIYFGQKK